MSDGNLTLDELYAEANAISRKWWGVDYDKEIRIVKRKWRSRYAAFAWYTKEPDRSYIVFSSVVNARRTRGQVIATLTHELVHWRLWSLGQPFHDADETFLTECLRVGAPVNGHKKVQAVYKPLMLRIAHETAKEIEEAVTV